MKFHQHEWTEAEREYLRQNYGAIKTTRIAHLLRVSKQVVYKMAANMRITKKQNTK